MNFTLDALKQKLSKPLPGIESHLRMAPKQRAAELETMKDKLHLARQSAVMILLFADNEKLKTVFIKRAEYDGVHSGQIAFPGGQKESFDSSFEATALRETQEEVGIESHTVEIIGRLTDLFIPPSNFLVKVFVGFCTQKPEYVLDTKEVQAVIEIDLDDFLHKSVVLEKDFPAKVPNSYIKAPYYSVNGIEIWGATAMITSELLDVLKK